jgi:hypothetical protein
MQAEHVEQVKRFVASVEKYLVQARRGDEHSRLEGDALVRVQITVFKDILEELRVMNDIKRSEVGSLAFFLRLFKYANALLKSGLPPVRQEPGQFAPGAPVGRFYLDDDEAAFHGRDVHENGNLFVSENDE